LLAEQIPNSAVVEIDALREMIAWMPIDQAVPINLENAVSIIKNFTHHGISCIVPYPLSQKNYEYMMANLSELGVDMRFITLAPPLEHALKNRSGKRELTDRERERLKHHYDIGIHAPSFGEIIDNSGQTPEETAEAILAKIIF
jgi:hypothetical protein